MLNLFPNPSPLGLALDPTGNRGYNFRAVLPQSRPLDDKILRVDYNFSSKAVMYSVRLLAGLPGAKRLQHHRRTSRRSMGPVPG